MLQKVLEPLQRLRNYIAISIIKIWCIEFFPLAAESRRWPMQSGNLVTAPRVMSAVEKAASLASNTEWSEYLNAA